jgi:HlyD family secretion protein
VLDPITQTAHKRLISIGRQNGVAYEILKGLEVGETVITSSYETYNDSEELVLVEKE